MVAARIYRPKILWHIFKLYDRHAQVLFHIVFVVVIVDVLIVIHLVWPLDHLLYEHIHPLFVVLGELVSFCLRKKELAKNWDWQLTFGFLGEGGVDLWAPDLEFNFAVELFVFLFLVDLIDTKHIC